MGYYSERIKGSNLAKQRHWTCVAALGISAVMAVGLYFSPGIQRMKKVIEQGYFDPSPEKLLTIENFQLSTSGFRYRTLDQVEKERNDSIDPQFIGAKPIR